MIKAKHTPGPWDAAGLTVYDTCMDGVASTHTAADALLIAAAPDMLEALQAAHKWLLICDDTRSDDDLKKVEAALRHAEGQP